MEWQMLLSVGMAEPTANPVQDSKLRSTGSFCWIFKLSLVVRTFGSHMVLMALATELDVLEILFRNQNKIFFLDTLLKDPNGDTPSSTSQGPVRALVFEHLKQLFMFIELRIATKHHVFFLSVNKILNDSSLRSPLRRLQFPQSSLKDILTTKLSHWSFIEG